MTNIVEKLPHILIDALPQKDDLDLLKLLVESYNRNGEKAVKDQINSLIEEILRGK